MPYYRGDYYRGDNYGYQAGGLFSFVGKALKTVAGAVYKTIVPAPVRGVVSGIQAIAQGRAAAAPFANNQTTLPMVLPPLQQAGLVNVGGAGPQTGLINIQPMGGGGGGGTVVGTTATGRRRRFCAKNIGGQAVLVPCPKRMNVTNVKALRRAGRRVKGFLKLARRLGALPVSSSGKKLFKAKRKSR